MKLGQLLTGTLLVAAATAAQGQFYKVHGGQISVGGFGQFIRPMTTNASSGNYFVPQSGGGVLNQTVSNQQQYTTSSAGFVGSFQFHPKPWAGVEVNYGFTHYSERYQFNYSSSPNTQTANVTTDQHEATAAYQFHPKHIPFQPFVNIGGGAVDFAPRGVTHQWRAAGLLETGFDVPTHNSHIGFRVGARSLYYRAPNFNNAAISTRSWRAQVEPTVSTYYRF